MKRKMKSFCSLLLVSMMVFPTLGVHYVRAEKIGAVQEIMNTQEQGENTAKEDGEKETQETIQQGEKKNKFTIHNETPELGSAYINNSTSEVLEIKKGELVEVTLIPKKGAFLDKAIFDNDTVVSYSTHSAIDYSKEVFVFAMLDENLTLTVNFIEDRERLSEVNIPSMYYPGNKNTFDASILNDEVHGVPTRRRSTSLPSSVGLTIGARVNYGTWSTNWMQLEGRTAYCFRPDQNTPTSGRYVIEASYGNTHRYGIMMYNLYGGEGYAASGVKALMESFGWNESLQYAYSHVIAGVMGANVNVGNTLGINDVGQFLWLGVSATNQARCLQVMQLIHRLPVAPEGFHMIVVNMNDGNNNQAVVGSYYEPMGSVAIQKTSANTGLSGGNALYSLAGARYGLYRDATTTSRITEFTTDVTGNTSRYSITAGTYYVKEISAPLGYKLDSTVYTAVVSAGNNIIVNVKDEPLHDPIQVLLIKLDKESGRAISQGNASLAGAQYTVQYFTGYYETETALAGRTPTRTWVFETDSRGIIEWKEAYKVRGDSFYLHNGLPTMPLGTLRIQETKAPIGYLLDKSVFVETIRVGTNNQLIQRWREIKVEEEVVRGGVRVAKWDIELKQNTAQGNATLQGTKIAIYNRSTNAVIVEGKEYAPNEVVATLTTGANGIATSKADFLPAGSYEVVELTPPNGYIQKGVMSHLLKIEKNGEIVDLTSTDTAIKNNVIRGGVEVEKRDFELDKAVPQGNATLNLTVIEIINRSRSVVMVNGVTYDTNEVVHTFTTGVNGRARTANDLLPHGQYEIREKMPPSGYQSEGILSRIFAITRNGEIVNMTSTDNALKNNVIRGGVQIEKWDIELEAPKAQGAGTLEGAKFAIINDSRNAVLVEGILYEPNTVVKTIQTNADFIATTSRYLLPYGDYRIEEVESPEGYLLRGELNRRFTIAKQGEVVQMNTETTAIKNAPLRADLKLVKIEYATMRRMGNIPFSITSKTTGESHVIVTDRNGMASTASNWNPHSQQTNRGETDKDGVWFGAGAVDDTVGALLYDTYIIDELPCEENKGKILIQGVEVVVDRNEVTIDLGTITNDEIPVPELGTRFFELDTENKVVSNDGIKHLVDVVDYRNIPVGEDYEIRLTVMVKPEIEGEEPKALVQDGEEVRVTLPVVIDKENGTIRVPVDIDTVKLGGKKLVAYEELWNVADKEEPTLVAEHKDIEDEGQTILVTMPELPESPESPEIPEEPTLVAEDKDIEDEGQVIKEPIVEKEESPLRKAAKTGDTTNAIIWILLAVTASVVVVCSVLRKRK